jgi:hypothetical protein
MVIVTFVAELPGVSGFGEISQIASEGAPVQVKATLWLYPPKLPRLKLYAVDCPGATVAEVEEPAATNEKSSPVPDRATACGLVAALSAMVRVAVRVPPAVGLKVTVTLHVPLGGTVAPEQVSALLVKSLAFVPLTAAVEITTFAPPLLVKVTCCALDGAFSTTEPKPWLASRLTAGMPMNMPKGDKDVTCAVIVSFV